MTEQIWRYHTPERDGHAPDDWVEGLETEILVGGFWSSITWEPCWHDESRYRYRPLQDAAYEPDLLAQCLALPQDQRDALIEAMQKPQRDWADDVWEQALSAYHGHDAGDVEAAAVIRSMCRPSKVELDDLWLHQMAQRVVEGYSHCSILEAADALEKVIREALS